MSIEAESAGAAIGEKPRVEPSVKAYEVRLYFRDFYGNPNKITIKVRLDIRAFEKIYLPVQQRKLSRSDTIKCGFWRVMQKTGINGHRRFYALRKTGASEIEKIDPTVTEMYLAHSEKGMKKNHAERDWTALGRALVRLGEVLGLKLDDSQVTESKVPPTGPA